MIKLDFFILIMKLNHMMKWYYAQVIVSEKNNDTV